MTRARKTTRLQATPASTVALGLSFAAVGLALVAAPGGLVWLSIYMPALGVENEGVLSLLANVVTIPAAVLSWIFASSSCVLAAAAAIRRRGGRRAICALTIGAPGAALGTIAIVVITMQLGTSLGVVPGPPDRQRVIAANAIAAHLALPSAGARLISRCEDREGTFNQQRRVTVIEPWSQPRLDQIRGRLRDYPATFSSGPSSPSDAAKVYFTGSDAAGHHITVSVGRYPPGTSLALACSRVRIQTEAMRTEILLSD